MHLSARRSSRLSCALALALLGACSSPHYSGSGRRSDLGDAGEFSLGVGVSDGEDAGDLAPCPERAVDASSAVLACDLPNSTCLSPNGSVCVCRSLDNTWHCP